jgi:hypothetical protein
MNHGVRTTFDEHGSRHRSAVLGQGGNRPCAGTRRAQPRRPRGGCRPATTCRRRAPACTRPMARWPLSAWTASPNSPTRHRAAARRRWATIRARCRRGHCGGPGRIRRAARLSRRPDGRPPQPAAEAFRPYRAMAVARGQPPPGPADLFFPDLSQRPPKREKDPSPLAPDALAARLKAARLGFERGLLKWIKNDPKGIAEMKVSVAMIEMTRSTPAARAYWWVALGVLDALAAGGLPDATEAKRFAMRLGAQIKKLIEGQAEPGEQLLREALYQAASATPAASHWPSSAPPTAWKAWCPPRRPSETERLLPHIRRLRELLAAAKDDWNRLCAGTAAALPPFHERTAKIAEEGAATGQPDYTRLTAAILEQTDQLRRDPSRHNEAWRWRWRRAACLPNRRWKTSSRSMPISPARRMPSSAASAHWAAARNSACWTCRISTPCRAGRRSACCSNRWRAKSAPTSVPSKQTLDAFFRDTSRQATLAALKQPIQQIQGALLVLGQDRANDVALPNARRPSNNSPQPGFTAQARRLRETWRKSSRRWAFSSPSCKAARPTSTPSSNRRRSPSTVHEEVETGGGRTVPSRRCRHEAETPHLAESKAHEGTEPLIVGGCGRRSPARLRSGRTRTGPRADLPRRPPTRSKLPAPVGRSHTPGGRQPGRPRRRTSRPSSSRKPGKCWQPSTSTCRNGARRTGRPRLAGHGAPQLPYAEGQRPHGRPGGTG